MKVIENSLLNIVLYLLNQHSIHQKQYVVLQYNEHYVLSQHKILNQLFYHDISYNHNIRYINNNHNEFVQ